MKVNRRREKKNFLDLRLITTLGPQGMPRGLVLMPYRRARELYDAVRGALEAVGVFWFQADVIHISRVAMIEVHLLAQ